MGIPSAMNLVRRTVFYGDRTCVRCTYKSNVSGVRRLEGGDGEIGVVTWRRRCLQATRWYGSEGEVGGGGYENLDKTKYFLKTYYNFII